MSLPNLHKVTELGCHVPTLSLRLSADQPSQLAEILSKRSRIPVVVAGHGDLLVAGTAYIGEPSIDFTLLERAFAFLTSDPARLYRNRTVDLLSLCGRLRGAQND